MGACQTWKTLTKTNIHNTKKWCKMVNIFFSPLVSGICMSIIVPKKLVINIVIRFELGCNFQVLFLMWNYLDVNVSKFLFNVCSNLDPTQCAKKTSIWYLQGHFSSIWRACLMVQWDGITDFDLNEGNFS